MKFAIVIALLFTLTANAQKSSPNADLAKAIVAPKQFTHADTVRALHNLFKSKRNTGSWLAYSSAATTAIAGIGTLADNNGKGHDPYFSPDAVGASLLIGIGLAPAWIPGTVTLMRFTKKREQKAIDEFELTKEIPHNLRKKLKIRFFNSYLSIQ